MNEVLAVAVIVLQGCPTVGLVTAGALLVAALVRMVSFGA